MEDLIYEFIIAGIGIIVFVLKHFYEAGRRKKDQENFANRINLKDDKIRSLVEQNRVLGQSRDRFKSNFEEGRKAYKSLSTRHENTKKRLEARIEELEGGAQSPLKDEAPKKTRKPRKRKKN